MREPIRVPASNLQIYPGHSSGIFPREGVRCSIPTDNLLSHPYDVHMKGEAAKGLAAYMCDQTRRNPTKSD